MMNGRGWWAFGGMVTATLALLLAAYVGAYRMTVDPTATIIAWSDPEIFVDRTAFYYLPGRKQIHVEWLFWPINQVDRRIRPKTWGPYPPDGWRHQAVEHDVDTGTVVGGQMFGTLAEGLRELPDVADVTVHGDPSHPAGIIIHIRNWHYLPLELFAADILAQSDEDIPDEESERLYREFLDEVEAVQKQQLPVVEWLAERGHNEIWVEGLTDDSIRTFEKYAADYTLWGKIRTSRLELGAPGRMLAEGKMKVLPLDDKLAMDAAEPDAITTEVTEEDNARREDAMVCRTVSAGRPVNVVMLGGAHDLRDGLKRLRCEGYCVVTVDVRAYRKAAGEE